MRYVHSFGHHQPWSLSQQMQQSKLILLLQSLDVIMDQNIRYMIPAKDCISCLNKFSLRIQLKVAKNCSRVQILSNYNLKTLMILLLSTILFKYLQYIKILLQLFYTHLLVKIVNLVVKTNQLRYCNHNNINSTVSWFPTSAFWYVITNLSYHYNL